MKRAARLSRTVRCAAVLGLGAALGSGCGLFSSNAPATQASAKASGTSSAGAADAAAPAPPLHLHVQADAKSNRGGPLYVVVRKTDAAAFLTEDAEQVAKDVFPNNADVILATAVLWPDRQASLVVPRADAKQSVGVYFLFSAPEDGKWRILVADARTTCLDIVLGPDSVRSFAPGASC